MFLRCYICYSFVIHFFEESIYVPSLLYRRSIVGFFVFFFYSVFFVSFAYSIVDIKEHAVQKAIDHFLSIQTIQGIFVQEDTVGNVIKGEFFMTRPSKFYFKYSSPSSGSLVSDGRNVAIYNAKLDAWTVYPLPNTAFGIIFSNKRNEMQQSIQRIETNNAFITLFFREVLTKNMISLTFDRLSYRLLNWEITDSSGTSILVKILKYKENITLKSELFVIPYDKIHNIE